MNGSWPTRHPKGFITIRRSGCSNVPDVIKDIGGFSSERRSQFHTHIVKAKDAFIELTAYTKEAFPQFDIEESDQASVDRYEQWKAKVDRQVGDIPASLRSHAGR